jgi:hypothetical protein
MSSRIDDRKFERLATELRRLSERTEQQTRYIESLEGRLRAALDRSRSAPATVHVADPIPPLRSKNVAPRAPARRRRGSPGIIVAERTDAPPEEASWWPRFSPDPRSLVPNAGWRNYTLRERGAKIVGVSVCGMPRAALEAAVAAVADQQSLLRDFIPVFLTDSPDFDVFRRRGFVWEYFPGPAARAGYEGATGWAAYGRARRALVERKWGLKHVIRIGPADFGAIPESPPPETRAETGKRTAPFIPLDENVTLPEDK